jgi:hypothetical protein
METKLAADESFIALSNRAAQAEAALQRAEANLKEVEQDAATKLPAFEQSALFTYLRDRGYGTEKYKHTGFTRRMDRSLAKLIGFNEAIQSFEFLTKTPEQMRQIIATDRAAIDTVMQELERRRDQVAGELRYPQAERRIRDITRQRDAVLARLDANAVELNSLQSQANALEDPQCSYYVEAIGVFRKILESIDSRDLQSHAAATREMTDDAIVAQLMGFDSSIGNLDLAARSRRALMDQLQHRMEAIGRLIQQFRAANFDSSQCQFLPTFDILQELEYVEDEQDLSQVWTRLRQAQRWGPSMMERVSTVATHPMTQVLVNAMAQAAGAAMVEMARSAGKRHAGQNRRRGW